MRSVLKPSCLDELFEMQKQHPDAMVIAGGTDLLVRLRGEVFQDDRPLLSLGGVTELLGIRVEGTKIAVGAATTFSRIIADPLLAEHAPLLAKAARTIGGPAIRNMATIGGNIRTASPAGDSLTPLHLLEAEIEIASRTGKRLLPVGEFITGPGRTALGDGELIIRILLPRMASLPYCCFEKVGRRRSMAIAVVSFSGMARLSGVGVIEEARFAWGSVGPTVVRISAVEQELTGSRLDPAAIRHAAQVVRESLAPISDIRATADYRRSVAANLLVRFLEGIRG
jgi:CO/xanthine dehydrogenase FAD-binding subunit